MSDEQRPTDPTPATPPQPITQQPVPQPSATPGDFGAQIVVGVVVLGDQAPADFGAQIAQRGGLPRELETRILETERPDLDG
jgi:hypothetical protein